MWVPGAFSPEWVWFEWSLVPEPVVESVGSLEV